MLIAASYLTGLLVRTTEVGGGALVAPALGSVLLTNLYPLRLTPSRLIATDIVHAVPLAMIAGLGHLLLENADFGLLGWLLVGSISGVLIGASLSARLPQRLLRSILAGVQFLIGIQLWWKAA
jgi:hypothetical protein